MWFEGAERSSLFAAILPRITANSVLRAMAFPAFHFSSGNPPFESVLSAEPLTNLPRVEVTVSSQIRAFSGNHSPFPRVSWACSAR